MAGPFAYCTSAAINNSYLAGANTKRDIKTSFQRRKQNVGTVAEILFKIYPMNSLMSCSVKYCN